MASSTYPCLMPFTTWSCLYKLKSHAYFFTISSEWGGGVVELNHSWAEINPSFWDLCSAHANVLNTHHTLTLFILTACHSLQIYTHTRMHTIMTRFTILHINYMVGNQYGDKHKERGKRSSARKLPYVHGCVCHMHGSSLCMG